MKFPSVRVCGIDQEHVFLITWQFVVIKSTNALIIKFLGRDDSKICNEICRIITFANRLSSILLLLKCVCLCVCVLAKRNSLKCTIVAFSLYLLLCVLLIVLFADFTTQLNILLFSCSHMDNGTHTHTHTANRTISYRHTFFRRTYVILNSTASRN